LLTGQTNATAAANTSQALAGSGTAKLLLEPLPADWPNRDSQTL
jgi:hypothetical protein